MVVPYAFVQAVKEIAALKLGAEPISRRVKVGI